MSIDVSIIGAGAGSPTPAAFPSILSTSGQTLVDENGYTMPKMKGFNVQPVPWSAQSYVDMYNKGARLIRTVVFWDKLEPTTKGTVDNTYVTTALDVHIQRLVAAGLYTTIGFYYGPAQHWPSWYTTGNGWPTNGGAQMGVLTAQNAGVYAGQFAVEYLAKRYGDPSDPLGAGQYTKAVIGFGINEPAPDSAANGYLATHFSEQALMIDWFRTYAPDWIGIISCGYGGGVPLSNIAAAGQTTQTFTDAVDDPFAGRGNWLMDLHAYFETTTDGATKTWDGRNQYGLPNNAVQIGPKNTSHLSYPPSGITRAQCQASLAAYFAPHIAYCGPSHANVPLMIGEHGWVPYDGTHTWTGGDLYAADLAAAMDNASPVAEVAWDYNTNQTQDNYASRPGVGAVGADTDGWQIFTNDWLAAA